MKPTIEILTRLQENSKNNHDEVFTKLFRYLLRPDIYYTAFHNLYANNGAATKGVNDDTADSFSEDKVSKIIEVLRNGTYKPKPVRRTYIKKKNGKQRPLGLPTFTDKLIQDVIRMILQAIYEPIFSNYSHGFRPGRSCHTALAQLKHEFIGAKWFVEGDIKGCFDNIDHSVLINIIGKKIKDVRFLNLIRNFLKEMCIRDSIWTIHIIRYLMEQEERSSSWMIWEPYFLIGITAEALVWYTVRTVFASLHQKNCWKNSSKRTWVRIWTWECKGGF